MLNDKQIEEILKEGDAKAFYDLSVEDMEDMVSELMYESYYKKEYQSLNEEQKTVLLTMALDDYFMADGLNTLLEDEEMVGHIADLSEALLYIGAGKSAMEIRKLNELLKKKKGKENDLMTIHEWLEENPGKKDEIYKINAKLEEHPDGRMLDLVYKFIRSDKEIAKKLLMI